MTSTADIDLRGLSVRVIGKGNKERIIYLNEACRETVYADLWSWIEAHL